MKKRFLLAVLSFVLVTFCTFFYTSCADGGGQNNEDSPFTVTFVTNGGTEIAPVTCTEASTLKSILGSSVTSRECKVFTGWFYDEDLLSEAPLSAVVSTDKTFYAG